MTAGQDSVRTVCTVYTGGVSEWIYRQKTLEMRLDDHWNGEQILEWYLKARKEAK